MTQRVIVDADTGRNMFRHGCPGPSAQPRTQRGRDEAGMVRGVDYCYGMHMGHGPSVFWLVWDKPLVCDADQCRGGQISFPEWAGEVVDCDECSPSGVPLRIEIVSATKCTKSYITGDSEPYNIGTGCACHRPEWCAEEPAAGCDECRALHPTTVHGVVTLGDAIRVQGEDDEQYINEWIEAYVDGRVMWFRWDDEGREHYPTDITDQFGSQSVTPGSLAYPIDAA